MRNLIARRTGLVVGLALALAVAAMACGTDQDGVARESGNDPSGAAQGIAVGEQHPGGESRLPDGGPLDLEAPCEGTVVADDAGPVEPVKPGEGAAAPDAVATVDPEDLIARTEIEAEGEEDPAGEPCEAGGVSMGMPALPTGEDDGPDLVDEMVVNSEGGPCSFEVPSSSETVAPATDGQPAARLTPEELEKIIERTEIEDEGAAGDEPISPCVTGAAPATDPAQATAEEK
jgi:hypothetical protein